MAEPVFAELEMLEPPLARELRIFSDLRKVITVHLIDGSLVKGIVEQVDRDGRCVKIGNGDQLYTVDVAALVMIQEMLT